MQKRESYLYVGMDLHKKTHTAVLVNCWNEKIETFVIENKPVEFEKLVKRVNRKALTLDRQDSSGFNSGTETNSLQYFKKQSRLDFRLRPK
ncbi:hypothetical protein SDC9_143882 [bioreactor metagenome]|uniref:Uncharacterized protein n=1 Tax=bioreactor metagenome TaxID=1076179 RepID=A0A645E4R9_9ZZZZ